MKRYLPSIAALCAVLTLLSSTAANATVSLDYSWTFTAKAVGDHVAFTWSRYPDAKHFQMYEIVRTTPDGPTAPDAGDQVATTDNRYSTNAEDAPPESGTYWYRLCADLTTGDKTCSKPLKVSVTVSEPIAADPVPSVSLASAVTAPLVPAPAPVIDLPDTLVTATPTAQILDAPSGELVLSAVPTDGGAVLTWTPPTSLGGSYKYIALVRSFEHADLSYPYDGYLTQVRDPGVASFTDDIYEDPAFYHAPRWYRACVVDLSDAVRCGPSHKVMPL